MTKKKAATTTKDVHMYKGFTETLLFSVSTFSMIKVIHCLETDYARVTRNSCIGISIHGFVIIHIWL